MTALRRNPVQGRTIQSESRLTESNDVVNTLITRTQRRPAFGFVTLLNNIAYLFTNLFKPCEPLHEILSRATEDTINSNFCTAKVGYFQPNLAASAGARRGQGEVGQVGKGGGEGEVHAVLRSV